MDKLAPTAYAQSGGGDSNDFLYDELWSEPRNLVGSPLNRVMDSSMIGAVLPEGSNFELSVPIYGLAGRGLSSGLALNYNSRIWSRHGSAVTFNATNTWPYVGFSISFGRIVTYGSSSALKYVLIDPAGTRRFLGTGGTAGQTVTLQTNDGSHITYVGNASGGGSLYLNNGTKMTVGLVNNRLLVTRIRDSNGNYIDISYASQASPTCNTGLGFQWKQAISTITDTLGRVIAFNYDDCNNLISITAPDFESGTQTLAQFDYQSGSISNSFSGLTVENRPTGSVAQLKHVYFPGTETGYKFSYSVYGMIHNVSMRKQMSIDGNGVISDGTEKAYVSFNYPTTASSLSDAPSFSQRTEFPAATSGGTAVYSYSTGSKTGTKSFTITRPDSSTVTLTRSNAAGVDFGLLTQSEIKNSGGTSMAKSVMTYANDPGGSPQLQAAISYDDATPTANQTKVDFDYDAYGNVTNTREYGFQDAGAWKVRRRSRSVYKTDTAYVDAYLRSLVIESDVYDAQLDTSDANDVLIAKQTFAYDDYTGGLGGMENYGGPTTPPPGHLTSYDATYTLRGNVTSRTIYLDVSAPTTITWLMKLDIFGNVVKRQLACCNEQTMTFTDQNGFALAESVTKGPSGGAQVSTSANYDFNTSLKMDTTDPNGQQTTINTRDEVLRPTLTTYPTGATASASFDDDEPSESHEVSYSDGGSSKTVSSSTVYDDLGRVIEQVDGNGGQVNTAYDVMGRVLSRTNPFTAGGTPGPATTYSYDALGRDTLVTLADGQTVQTTYNGNSVTAIDQVNRKIQRLSDGLGRLLTVNEQDVSSGTLNQATSYSYDYLDKLTQVNQGSQLRSYKYDSAGRLLYEKIPEQSATINDGTGVFWSSKYTYTTFNAVATTQDARGVIATYSYDSLNRLTQVSYNAVSGVTTAPTVSYVYDSDSTYGTTADGMLLRINVGSDYQERYTVDSDFRVVSSIRTIGTRTYTTSYGYNEASQLKQLTYPSTRVVDVSYDSVGRLNSLVSPPGNGNVTYLSSVAYDVAGQATGDTLGNGVTEVFGYDANRMQLTSQKAGTASPYTNRMDVSYGYQATSGQMGSGSTAGNAGQLMSVSGTINSTTESAAYTYDNLGRLVTSNQTSNGSSGERLFEYDRWGNRTGLWDQTKDGTQIQSITLQQSGGTPTNRITSVTSGSTVSYTYDSSGNVTNDGVHTYTYDSENRIVSVDGGSTASSAYDHQNRRYKKTVGSAVTHYVWQGSKVLAEHNGSTGAVVTDYVYSGSRMIAKIASGSPQYFLSDRLSVRMTLDTSGNVLGRQAHLPYGEDFGESGTQEKHHFTSYERDNETATDYAINRGYSRLVGRFAQADPYRPSGRMMGPQTWNRYSYTRNDPINRIDYLGLQDEPIRIGVTACYGGGYLKDFGGVCPSGSPGTAGRHAKLEDTGNEGVGGGGGGELPYAPLVLSLLRGTLDKMLRKNGNKCGNFVQNLINQVAKDTGEAFFSDDALSLFDTISGPEGGGYLLEQALADGVPVGGTVRGGIGNTAHPPTVIISPVHYGGSDFNLRAAHRSYALTALHETIHLATGQGVYSDRELATAVVNLGGLSQAELDAYNSLDPSDVLGNSAFWDKYLAKHCD